MAADTGRVRVLVVGQVPPPTTGQTVMVQTLLDGRYSHAELHHVDSAFSTTVADMGRGSARKIVRLAAVLHRSLRARSRHRTDVLYYHPAGSNRSAVLRDVVLLLALRRSFRQVVFHCHALGLPAAVATLPRPLRALARRAYRRPDLVLGPSAAVVDETASLFGRPGVVVPNGTAGGTASDPQPPEGRPLRILFLNMISEAKGASWLLEAVAALHADGVDVELELAGEVASDAYRNQLADRARAAGIGDRVRFVGLQIGPDKWRRLSSCDVFCVPTTYPQETFGLAMVEAASCARPVVTTNVPGVRELFVDGESVMLAEPSEPESLHRILAQLAADPDLRRSLALAGRAVFEARYTLERFWTAVDDALASLIAPEPT